MDGCQVICTLSPILKSRGLKPCFMKLVGEALARGVDPASVGVTAADSIVTAPATTGTALVVLAQPALAAAVYTFLAAWNGHPTLDRPDRPDLYEVS